MKKAIALIIAAALVIALAGCGSGDAGVSAIEIYADGAPASKIEIMYAADDSPLLTAVVTGGDGHTPVVWTSSDDGVVRVSDNGDGSCTLRAVKTGTAKISAACGGVSVSVKTEVVKNEDSLTARDAALTVGDVRYSAEAVNIFYVEQYLSFMDAYGEYAFSFGIAEGATLQDIEDKECTVSDEGGSWRDYFIAGALESIVQVQALCDYAEENGITLTDEDTDSINARLDKAAAAAAENGFDSEGAYLESVYGKGVTDTMFKNYLDRYALAGRAYTVRDASLTYTDDEVAAYVAENYGDEDEYNTVSMRHIYFAADAAQDEDPDEVLKKAHDKAEEVYAIWKAGDATEESFAALANEYSTDTGTNTTGGLFVTVHKDQMSAAVDEWLFGERQPGDTAVIDAVTDYYSGTHILYFISEGGLYSLEKAESEMRSNDMDEWFNALTGGYRYEFGPEWKV